MTLRTLPPAAILASLCLAAAPPAPAGDWDVTAPHGPYRDVEFTVDEGTWMSVDVSPDGETLLFDLLGDIYAVPAGGGTARLVHGGPALQIMPRFGPRGDRMVYLSDASGSDNIWTSAADGSDAAPVTDETVDVVVSPTWGPEDHFVAAKTHAQASETGSSELRLYHRSGGKGRLLVAKPENGTNVFEPEVSPDGRHLYYTERVTALHQSHIFIDPNHVNFAVMHRDLETGATERLIGGFGGATTPRVSPDGERLAFVRRVKAETVLFVYDLESGEQRPVYAGLSRDAQASFIPQGTYYPRYDWFPDGRHIAIWARGKLRRVDTVTGAAEVIPIEVTARHRVTQAPHPDIELAPETFTVRAIEHLTAAPGGDAVTFTGLDRLWSKSLPDGTPHRLTDGDVIETDPAYAPDGRRIAYAAWDDEKRGAIRVVAAAGGEPRTVARSPGVVHGPAFSPDGKTLAYQVSSGDKCVGGYSGEPGLYTVPADGGEPRRLTGDGRRPRFSPDGSRIYFLAEHEGLPAVASVARDGGDRRVHVVAADPDVSTLRPSPNLRTIAFKDRRRIYVAPYRETGEPMTVGASQNAIPVTEVTPGGGYALTWGADSRSLHWAVGPQLHTARIDAPAAGGRRVAGHSQEALNLEVESDVPDGGLAFVDARLITMRGDEVIERGTLVVEGNRIAAVGPSVEVTVPDGAKVIDAAGKTILPGLVDMHGHLNDCYYANAGLKPQKVPSHYAALAFGVTTNYDPYTSDLPTFALTEKRRAGLSVGPRLMHTGLPLHGRAGRPDGSYVPIDDYADAERVLALKDALGAPAVKSYKQPMRRQRQQIVAAAREHGIMADAEGEAHFYFNLSMILDGYTALEHNLPVPTYHDDLIQLFAHSDTAHTPTLIILFGGQLGENYLYQTTRSWEDPRIRDFVPETTSGYNYIASPHSAPPHVRGMTTAQVAEELWDIGIRSVADSMKELMDAGVTINAGSHGQIQGVGLHWEMWLLAEGGMSEHDVLRTATINGARTLNLDHRLGTLSPGKLADLIVLEDNPLADIRHTRSVSQTMINGRLYDSHSMDEIGNHPRPRGAFYWEQRETADGLWSPAWGNQ
ncbi:amidohydrolase [Salinisphaera sp. PC39]|uniref:amidohydrolase family protein n=1 Tax=Salinisphaera sp. PC39 TaxID=1304156 RepID=UPI003341D365